MAPRGRGQPAYRPRRAGQSPRTAGPAWIQANCAVFLAVGSTGPVPAIPWSSLGDALTRWREERRFERFFFVRKPPGLRLRFLVSERGAFEPLLAKWLVAAEEGNELRGFRFGHYEPEQHRFGGPVGMALAHQLFDLDAPAAIAYESLPGAERERLSSFDLSAALSVEWLGAATADRAEMWDVWSRLQRLVGPSDGAAPPSPGISSADEIADRLPRAAVEAFDRARQGAATVAGVLAASADAGLLDVGVRRWLVAATPFHWNRWGLPLDRPRLAALCSAMVEHFRPDGPPDGTPDGTPHRTPDGPPEPPDGPPEGPSDDR